MIQGKCKNPNCTVAETGICLESHQNVTECPNFTIFEGQTTQIEELISEPSISDSVENDSPSSLAINTRQFHSGNELGIVDAAIIMRKRYTRLIGILGSTNVGKTCILSSLYLLSSQGEMYPDFIFSGSLTLQGFEERVRGVRSWSKGKLPDQIVEHTRLQDPRSPAFMHLCLKGEKTEGKFIDFLLTDLPGEWTDSMIDNSAASASFSFLRRADCIFYVIDGIEMNNIETKNIEIYRAKLAIDRLVQDVKIDPKLPFVVLVSKGDAIGLRLPDGTEKITEYAKKRYGLDLPVILTVAFSRNPGEIKSGVGIFDAISYAFKPFVPNNNKIVKLGERSFWSA